MPHILLLQNLLALGFTVTDLGQLCDVSSQAISQWLHGGKRPSDARCRDLLRLYAFAADYLSAGGTLGDFMTSGIWKSYMYTVTSASCAEPEERQLGRLIFTPERLQGFKAAESLPPRDRALMHTELTLAQAMETLTPLLEAGQRDPAILHKALGVDDLYVATVTLQQCLIMRLWDRAVRTPLPQPAPTQEEPDAHQTP